jgi:DHA1 family tetracycline resistance protein-like MFS transporter
MRGDGGGAVTRHPPSLVFLVITLAIDALGIGIIVPITPELVRQISGLDPAGAAYWQGWMVAAFAFAQLFCGPIIGGLSDRFGRRPVILISVGGLGLGYLMLVWAPTLAWVLVARLVAGATAANASAANAYIADITPPEQRAKRFGLVGAVWGAAFILGPAIGGQLGAISLRLPFAAAAALAFLNVLYGVFVLPESLPRERRRRLDWRRANVFGSLAMLTANSERMRLAVAWAATWFGVGVQQAVFVLYTAERLEWGPAQNGLVLGLVGLLQVIVQLVLVRRLVPRLGERRALMLGNVLSAAGYAAYGFADSTALILLGVLLQSLGAIAGPSVQSLIASEAGPERQGEMQGALSSVQGLTAIVAPLLGAYLFARLAHLAPGAAFFTGTAMFLLSAVLARGLRDRQKQPETV